MQGLSRNCGFPFRCTRKGSFDKIMIGREQKFSHASVYGLIDLNHLYHFCQQTCCYFYIDDSSQLQHSCLACFILTVRTMNDSINCLKSVRFVAREVMFSSSACIFLNFKENDYQFKLSLPSILCLWNLLRDFTWARTLKIVKHSNSESKIALSNFSKRFEREPATMHHLQHDLLKVSTTALKNSEEETIGRKTAKDRKNEWKNMVSCDIREQKAAQKDIRHT